MLDDPRCCGSGTCIIDAEGICWCGQRWEGNRLIGPASACATVSAPATNAHPQAHASEAALEPHRAPAHPGRA